MPTSNEYGHLTMDMSQWRWNTHIYIEQAKQNTKKQKIVPKLPVRAI